MWGVGGEWRRLLSSAGTIRRCRFFKRKGAWAPTNTIKDAEAALFSGWLTGAWKSWNTLPAAARQRSPSANTTPRWGF